MSGIVIQICNNGQITLPATILRKTNLKPGDLLKVNIESDGSIHLTPQIAIDRSQAYFWAKRWQEGECHAEEDIRLGHVKKFDNVDDLITDLESDQ
jgi:AbrB family looped-hinge helix DNA binding protein